MKNKLTMLFLFALILNFGVNAQRATSMKIKEEGNGFLYYYDQSKNAKDNMNSISQWLFDASVF